jgi:predicted nucleotidyltransferase
MKLIAYGKAKVVGTNKTILLEEEFPLYYLDDIEWERIIKAKNTALAYMDVLTYKFTSDCQYKGENLVYDPAEYPICNLIDFMRENLNKGLKLKLKK